MDAAAGQVRNSLHSESKDEQKSVCVFSDDSHGDEFINEGQWGQNLQQKHGAQCSSSIFLWLTFNYKKHQEQCSLRGIDSKQTDILWQEFMQAMRQGAKGHGHNFWQIDAGDFKVCHEGPGSCARWPSDGSVPTASPPDRTGAGPKSFPIWLQPAKEG